MVIRNAIAFAIVALTLNAYSDDIRLGEPTYGGTGCPIGTASVALSPEQKTLSVLFDQYVVEAGGMNKALDRKNCNLAIPVHIPQGYSLAVMAVDYRGFVSVPRGGSAQLSVNYFLAGAGRGVRTTKSFVGPLDSDYLKSDDLDVEAVVWTPCGADTILRTNTTLLVRSNARRDEAMATVDSMDIESGLIYHFEWRRCR